MTFTEWFDVTNKKHIDAYNTLSHGGAWPTGFIPSNVTLEPQWQLLLLAKMADKWVKAVLGEIQVPK